MNSTDSKQNYEKFIGINAKSRTKTSNSLIRFLKSLKDKPLEDMKDMKHFRRSS